MFSDPVLEDLLSQIGKTGRYQMKQHLLHLLTAFLAGLHMLSLTFVAPTPQHRCLIPEIDGNGTSMRNFTFDRTVLSPYIPLKQDGSIDGCHKFENIDGDGGDGDVIISSCKGQHIFDKGLYKESRVYEWDMVCENKWQRALIQSIYVFGVFNGALICGALSDRFGRKRVLCISAIFQFIFAMSGGFIANYKIYCVNLFLYGFFGSGGAFVTGFVLSMELVNRKNRTYIGCAFSAGFAIGICFNALWGYLIPDDVTLLQIVLALHASILFGHFWLIDESIRWLWGQGEYETALEIVRKACKVNDRPFKRSLHDQNRISIPVNSLDQPIPSHGLSDLFRKPNIRCRAVNTAFIWFALALCFYGLAFNTGSLPGNPYVVFLLLSSVDLPGHLFVTLIVDRTGRRSLNSSLLLIGGCACVGISFMPRGIATTTIAMIAKIALAGCFAVMYNYTAELFPTVVRNSAVGLCSMAARFGGMLTPQITLLDSLDRRIPTVVFGVVAILASFLGLFLPETINKEMPQSLEDGENFGEGDTAFARFRKKRITSSSSSTATEAFGQGQEEKKKFYISSAEFNTDDNNPNPTEVQRLRP